MKLAECKPDMVMSIAEAAVRRTLANQESAAEIAGKHAIRMVERIAELMDSRMTDEKLVDEIRKVIFLASAPPHI